MAGLAEGASAFVRDDANDPFAVLLREVRTRSGLGALLNTSFNIHSEPLVCSPTEALRVHDVSGADALAIGSFLIRQTSRPGAA